MPQVTTAQRDDAWYAARIGKLTASLAGAVLRINPYKTPQSAWREIMGCKTDAEHRIGAPGTPAHWGVIWEAPARLAYEAQSGNWVNETGFWVSDEHPWLGSSPDGTVGDDGVLEVKCPEFCSHKILPCYRVQCLIHMVVTGRAWVDFCQYGWRTEELWVQRVYPLSSVGTQALLKRLKNWWDVHVAEGEEPPRKKPKRHRKSVMEVVESPAACNLR